MKRARWGCFELLKCIGWRRVKCAWPARVIITAAALGLLGLAAVAAAVPPPRTFGPAWVHAGSETTPPNSSADWRPIELPLSLADPLAGGDASALWLRVDFDYPAKSGSGSHAWAVYLPYLAAGGQLWANGLLLEDVQSATQELQVNWYRPFLIIVPMPFIHNGGNTLLIRTPINMRSDIVRLASVTLGPQTELLPIYERRMFWINTMPRVTIVVCVLVAGFALFIWWRRRGEALYGLFGLAAALWGVRTSTFVIEMLPPAQWHVWRLIVQVATVGFIVTLAAFTFRLAELRRRWVERALFAYWLIGTVWFVATGPAWQLLVKKVWTGGLIPLGIFVFGVSIWIVWRDRIAASAFLPAAMGLAVLAGWHDYAVEFYPSALNALLPGWAGQRFYLLHHAANLLLLAMAALLARRFIQAVSGLEELNLTLEARVADRERALAANYEQLAALQRQHAAAEERQLIMRDLHDGLGSQLFTSLSRVERGEMNERQIAAALRDCIADMRLALDALASQHSDVGSALADFMFRWEPQLQAAGVQPRWDIDADLQAADLTSHDALQVLRIAQEALTNVLRHARATRVRVRLARPGAGELLLEIEDNGDGLASAPARHHGRGLVNMQNRARRLNGRLDLRSSGQGTCVTLQLRPAAAPADGPVQSSGLQDVRAPAGRTEGVATHHALASPAASGRAHRPAPLTTLAHHELPQDPAG